MKAYHFIVIILLLGSYNSAGQSKYSRKTDRLSLKKRDNSREWVLKLDENGKLLDSLHFPTTLIGGDTIYFEIPFDTDSSFLASLKQIYSSESEYKKLCMSPIFNEIFGDTLEWKLLEPYSPIGIYSKNYWTESKNIYSIYINNEETINYTIKKNTPIKNQKLKIGYTKNIIENILTQKLINEIREKSYVGFDAKDYDPNLFEIEPLVSKRRQELNFYEKSPYNSNKNKFWNLYLEVSNMYLISNLYYLDSLNNSSTTEIDTLISNSLNKAKELDKLVTNTMQTNKFWMYSFLFLTNGIPQFNPFGMSDTSAISNHLRSYIELLNKNINSINLTNNIFKENKKLSFLIKERNSQIERLKQLPVLDLEYRDKIKAISLREKLLFKGYLFISNREKVNWMIPYNASSKYSKYNEKYPDRISDLDEIRLLTVNLGEEAETRLNEQFNSTQNVSDLEQHLDLSQISEAIKNSIYPRQKVMGPRPPEDEGQTKKEDKTKKATHENLYNCILSLDSVLIKAKWLSEQSEPPESIELKNDNDPSYRMEEIKPVELTKKKGSGEVDYNIIEKKSGKEVIVVDNEKYRIYPLTRFVPVAGMVHHFKDRYASVYSDGKFTSIPFNRLDYLFGVKIFPWKTNIQYSFTAARHYRSLGKHYNIKRGNGWENRLNVFIGLGTEKIFRNYYVGIGIDPFPWLQLHTGANSYIRKRYTLVNGNLTGTQDQLTYGGWYVSAALSATMVGDLLKIINPF